jgi:lipoprotein signal peptidase
MKISTERPYLWLFALLAVVGLAADQVSKYVVFTKLYPDDLQRETVVPVIPDYFSLRTIYSVERDEGDHALSYLRTISGERLPEVNRGALFGIGNETNMNNFFAVLSICAAGFILFWASRPSVARDRYLCLALGLILGGTLGNFYDRIVFGGVRDFLHCYYVSATQTHVWPDFNIADCCLVCGAGILLAHSILISEPKAEPESAEPVPVAAGTNEHITATPPGHGA